MYLKRILLFCSLLTISVSTAQEEKSEQLGEVVITATRTLRQLSSLPLPAQMISKKEIERTNSVKLIEVLNEQTGLVTVPDYGGGEGVQLQGMDSQYTLILIDGVPLVGRLAGTLDLSRISVGNIKQIEVIKGASSSLYGNEALGGVINIITDKPKWGLKGDVALRYDSFSNLDISGTVNYKEDNLGLTFFANRYKSEGYDLDKSDEMKTVDPFVNNTFSAKADYTFSENTNLLVSGRYYYQKQNVGIKTTDGKYAEGKGYMNEWNTHVKLSHTFSEKWKSFLELYTTEYMTNQYYETADHSISDKNDFDQLLIKPELRVIYEPKENHQFIAGVGMTHEALDKSYFIDVPKFNSIYSYLQYDAEFFDKLNVITGLRFDKHSEYGSQLSPKVAIRYKATPKLNIRGSVGYGFKTPDFRQLYNNFTNSAIGYTVLGYNAVKTMLPKMQNEGQILNITTPISEFEGSLDPESSIGYNMGFDYKINSKLSVNANFFRNDIKNLIDTYSIAKKTNGLPVFTYRNISKVYTQGIETNVKYKINHNLNVSAGYQYLLAKDKNAKEEFKQGKEYISLPDWSSKQLAEKDYFGLFNRSKHMVNMKIFYRIPKWNMDMNLRAIYRSKYGLTDTNGNSYLDSYDKFINGHTLWNMAVNKTFYRNYQLSLGVNNILDFTNKEITNIPGRIIYAKLFVKF
ncbi:MAG: TonB-dependent receptor [Flavobacteriaceae bacterium]|nr:TonB-dependent receptor [Flavobacteriaceae bacterium]